VNADPESDALHARARAFVAAFEAARPMPESFDALAADVARFQASRVEGYARLCKAHGVDVAVLARAADAPAVPTDAFKAARIATFPEGAAAVTFRTSGTTIGARGAHAMRTTETYDRGAVAFARATLARGMTRPRVVCLASPPEAMPDSSLVHMMATFCGDLGGGDAPSFFVDGDVIDLAALDEAVARATADGRPVLLLGTALAFAHLVEGMDEMTFRLPPGSRAMPTGGYKGKAREVSEAALRREMARVLCIPDAAIVGEYGMTELSSQFYERAPGVYVEPPWARVVPVDPDTLAPAPDGAEGIARVEDLLNVDSAMAVLTADRVRRVPGGFALLGRAPGAPPRGCSIAVDEILGR
jgi:hypothetical protein